MFDYPNPNTPSTPQAHGTLNPDPQYVAGPQQPGTSAPAAEESPFDYPYTLLVGEVEAGARTRVLEVFANPSSTKAGSQVCVCVCV